MTNEEAIYVLKNTAWLGSDKDREATEEAVNMAIEALSVDAVEVVRCKDCVRKQEWLIDYTHDSDWFCTLHECAMNDDDFCSYGERREP